MRTAIKQISCDTPRKQHMQAEQRALYAEQRMVEKQADMLHKEADMRQKLDMRQKEADMRQKEADKLAALVKENNIAKRKLTRQLAACRQLLDTQPEVPRPTRTCAQKEPEQDVTPRRITVSIFIF